MVIPYNIARAFLVLGVILFVFDFTTSSVGMQVLPVNPVGDGYPIIEAIWLGVLAALPQFGAIVVGYALSAVEMGNALKQTLSALFFLLIGVDTVTGVAFFYDGSGWASMVTAIVLSFVVFTLGSEFIVTFVGGFVLTLRPEYKKQRALAKAGGRRVRAPDQGPRQGDMLNG